jgi:hypothetical protein
LSDRRLTGCDDFRGAAKSAVGLMVSWKDIMAADARAAGGCDIRAPDVIFDIPMWRANVLATGRYEIVWEITAASRGHMRVLVDRIDHVGRTGSGAAALGDPPFSATRRIRQFIAIRKDLLRTSPGGL